MTTTLPIEDWDHIRQNPRAPAVLLEYGDFECPYCARAHRMVADIEAGFGDQLCFVFRHFPLAQIHPHATDAAAAAEAAGLQGAFWEMHDTLFAHQHALEGVDLLNYAAQLGLDLERFVEDMASSPVRQRIREDFLSGVRNGVNGTPTFFVNGHRHDYWYDSESLRNAIKRSLQTVGAE